MNIILVYVLGIIGAVVGAAFVVSFIYLVYVFLQNRKLKKVMPDIKDPIIRKEEMFDIGKVKDIDIKEVKEDERNKFERYREFEKLRRFNQGKPNANSGKGISTGNSRESERSPVENKPSDNRKSVDLGNTQTDRSNRKSVSLD